jgi:hypothetical protein
MNALAERIEEAMRDYYYHPKVRWSRWPKCAEYVAARLQGKVQAPSD